MLVSREITSFSQHGNFVRTKLFAERFGALNAID